MRWKRDERDLGALELLVSPAIVRFQGHRQSSAGPDSGYERGLKPGLEHICIHLRARLREVRQGARVTWSSIALALICFANHRPWDPVTPSFFTRENEGDAVLSFHSLRTSYLLPLASLYIRSIWDTPVEEPGIIHVVDSCGGVFLELLCDLGNARSRRLCVR